METYEAIEGRMADAQDDQAPIGEGSNGKYAGQGFACCHGAESQKKIRSWNEMINPVKKFDITYPPNGRRNFPFLALK